MLLILRLFKKGTRSGVRTERRDHGDPSDLIVPRQRMMWTMKTVLPRSLFEVRSGMISSALTARSQIEIDEAFSVVVAMVPRVEYVTLMCSIRASTTDVNE